MNQASEAQAFSIAQFCAAHNLGRATFYNLQRDGRAPRTMKVGRRVLVSIEAAAEWRKRMESVTADIPASV